MRYLFVAACLGAAATLIHVPASQAGSIKSAAKASYSTASSAPVSRASDSLPDNCIREACGRLFCWNTGSRR